MTTKPNDYHQELREILLRLRYGLNSEINKDTEDVLAAIERLNASTIGEDETLDDCPIEKHLCPKVDRNQLRSELRQKFGVDARDIDVPSKKEDK